MPKAKGMKYYAVAVGRDAPGIYSTWDECSAKVTRYPKAVHRSFKTRVEAEEWLASKASLTALYAGQNSGVIEKKHSPLATNAYHQEVSHSSPVPLNVGEPPKPEQNQPESKVTLSPEQSRVFARVKEGWNVFFTGSAGTGKSVLLREVIKLRCGAQVAITASTGIAAINIGGATLHSWAGIGLGTEPVERFVGKVRKQPLFEPLLRRWRGVKTLIIDEISMIDGTLFDYLEQIARELRKNSKPFGGIQLVLCGDFCQLPPVPGKDKKGREIPSVFAFEARSWNSCIGAPMMLTQVFRQKDQTFANMLNEMRYGKMQESTIKIFQSLARNVTYTDGIEPSELYPTRNEVGNANNWRLRQLPGELSTYEAQDSAGVDHKNQRITYERMTSILDKLMAPKKLELKVGAQVMLIKNLQQGVLVNGSIGQVIRFDTPCEAVASNTEIAKVETGNMKDQARAGDNGISQEVMKPSWKWPVVKFTNGATLVVMPTGFEVHNGDGETMMAKRLQLPLILAWALSVHKSQGQTLERVRVDLRRTFEKGQAYVALSRATNMEHLQVLNFSPEKVMAHPKVLAWYGENVSADDFEEDDLTVFNECHH